MKNEEIQKAAINYRIKYSNDPNAPRYGDQASQIGFVSGATWMQEAKDKEILSILESVARGDDWHKKIAWEEGILSEYEKLKIDKDKEIEELKAEIERLKGVYHYRFIYKGSDGNLGVKIVSISKQDKKEAIAEFESKYPQLPWRAIQEVQIDEENRFHRV